MRVSSVMRPASSCGTLRSARMKTRLPASWPAATRSEKRRTFIRGRRGSRILRLRRSPRRVSPRIARARTFHPLPAARSCAAAHGDRAMPSTFASSPLAGIARALVGAACMTGAVAFAQLRRRSRRRRRSSRRRRSRLARAGAAGRRAPSSRCGCASLQVDVEVAGGAAETRVQMVFFNPNTRVLEGKLQFPLAPGQVVSGFALDVDGQLRDAVPVEKARAQQVFEDIARRRVDPGLLQTTIGNNYELRIYPLLPGKTRTVVLRIVEPARGPAPGAARLRRSRRRARRCRCAFRAPRPRPSWPARSALGLRFERDAERRLRRPHDARTTRRCRRSRSRCACRRAAQAPAIATEERDGAELLHARAAGGASAARRGRCRIACRSSGTPRARARTASSTASWPCSTPTSRRAARHRASAWSASPTSPPRRCASSVRGGDWSALRKALEATVYDGASNLGAVRHDGVSAEALWFSDGLANYGAPWRLAFPVPVFAISSAASGDPAALQALADASGGRSIDLATADAPGRGRRAAAPRHRAVAGVSALGARELVVQSQSAAAGPARRRRRPDRAPTPS